MSLFNTLKHECLSDWQSYVEHDFIYQLAQGALPMESFRHYLQQDYRYLTQFARILGLAIYKSRDLDTIRASQLALNTLLDIELSLHIDYCRQWGISKSDLEALPEAGANIAYTRYVIDCGHAGDLLDMHAAMAPCIVGYHEIARRLADDPATRMQDNPYSTWINEYKSDAYREVSEREIQLLDKLGADIGQQKHNQLKSIFRTATRMETQFWQMGLDRSF